MLGQWYVSQCFRHVSIVWDIKQLCWENIFHLQTVKYCYSNRLDWRRIEWIGQLDLTGWSRIGWSIFECTENLIDIHQFEALVALVYSPIVDQKFNSYCSRKIGPAVQFKSMAAEDVCEKVFSVWVVVPRLSEKGSGKQPFLGTWSPYAVFRDIRDVTFKINQ